MNQEFKNLKLDTKALRLFNTMSREKEVFEPVDSNEPVRMYNCGPTVYNFAHIGNLRAFVFADTLRRTLEANGYEVKQVINITDVGHLVSDGDEGQDKMTKGLEREGLPITLSAMKQLGDKYTNAFKSDLEKLHIKKPDYFPKASEHIDEDIALVELLDSKGFVYETSDGLYFDTAKLEDYGKLAGKQLADDDGQTRVENDEKKSPRDFALWKFNNRLGWKSPWGQGFPGWHIECSVMSMQYLGESFDIHTGGIEHIPVHHTNEIAQSEAATGKPMARFWMHNDWLTIEDEKVSKSLGNILYLNTIEKQGYSPLAYRYLLFSARYRTRMNFSWAALDSANQALQKLYSFMRQHPEHGEVLESYATEFMNTLNDDLNTPQAVAVIWKLIDDDAVEEKDKAATITLFDTVLALDLANPPKIDIPAEVKKLATEREEARQAGDFQLADELRDKIESTGWQVNDKDDGFEITPLH